MPGAKRDKAVKVTAGQSVKTGQVLVKGLPAYKAGVNVAGKTTLFAVSAGKAYFTRKKTSHGRVRTFVNVEPQRPNKTSA